MVNPSIRSLACLCSALVLLSCGRFRKAKECSLLADTVSAWMSQQKPASPADADTAALVSDARSTAARYHELDRTLSGLKLESEDLVPLVVRYRKMAVDSARALEAVSAALAAGDLEAARKLRVDFDSTIRAETPLVNEINAECRR
jgi:hypothetical protein